MDSGGEIVVGVIQCELNCAVRLADLDPALLDAIEKHRLLARQRLRGRRDASDVTLSPVGSTSESRDADTAEVDGVSRDQIHTLCLRVDRIREESRQSNT